jgi:hypothetical protein
VKDRSSDPPFILTDLHGNLPAEPLERHLRTALSAWEGSLILHLKGYAREFGDRTRISTHIHKSDGEVIAALVRDYDATEPALWETICEGYARELCERL